MAAKAMFTLSAVVLLIQSTLSQCLPLGGCGCNSFIPAASTGGNFVVTSSSPTAPIGVSVVSDNLYEGALIVEGSLPLLGSVALEGTMGTTGAGAVSYGCGDGDVVIVAEEGPIVTGIAPEAGYLGYGNGLYGGFGNGFYGFGNGFHGFGNGFYGFGNGCNNGIGNGFFGFGNGFSGFGNGFYGFGNGNYGYGIGNGIYGLGDCGCGLGIY